MIRPHFIQPLLSPRPAGEGRMVHDHNSYVVANPDSLWMIEGLRTQVVPHALFYGAGTSPGVGGVPFSFRANLNAAEVPALRLGAMRSAYYRQLVLPSSTPLPMVASAASTTPLYMVRGGARTELPPAYLGRRNPAWAQSLAAIGAAIFTGVTGARTPGAIGWDGLAPQDPMAPLILNLKYRLLEPPGDYADSSIWQLWTLAEIQSYVDVRSNRFLLETGMGLGHTEIVLPLDQVAADGLVDMPGDILELRRLSYQGPTGASYPLKKMDPHGLAFGVGVDWETQTGTPLYYVAGPEKNPLKRRIVPAPVAGSPTDFVTLQVHYVRRDGFTGIPALFIPYIQWGVLADMLSKEGEANDPVRAKYAESRFQEGIELAKMTIGRVV